jgi:hypothetical protein
MLTRIQTVHLASNMAGGVVIEPKLQPPANNNRNAKRTARFSYDFGTQGGTVGLITLVGDALPAKSVVVDGRLYVTVALTGGALAAAGIDLVAASDVVTSAAVTGVPWNTTGDKAINPVAAAAHDIVCAAGGSPSLDITNSALTAGHFDLFLDYYVTD